MPIAIAAASAGVTVSVCAVQVSFEDLIRGVVVVVYEKNVSELLLKSFFFMLAKIQGRKTCVEWGLDSGVVLS